MSNIIVPAYYEKFICTGTTCEDTCCNGWWNVTIDYDTFQRYQQNTPPELAPLFKLAISKNNLSSANETCNYGLMKMKPDGDCYFLQTDKLCAIHAQLGAEALSDTCRVYPRYLNQFGTRLERSLGISCPEAARLILLNPEPMQFSEIPAEPGIDHKSFTSFRFPYETDGDPLQIDILNEFRSTIFAILQFRKISLGARMMLLGFLLEEIDRIISDEKFTHASELIPALQTFIALLNDPTRIEKQFAQIETRIPLKVNAVTELVSKSLDIASSRFKACVQDAFDGLSFMKSKASENELSQQYLQKYNDFYLPYFSGKNYIFENYLVNQVLNRLFPFTRGSYLDLYREMVCNLSIIQVLLVGIAAKHHGLNDGQVIQLLQTYARNSTHNSNHLGNMLDAFRAGEYQSFVDVMWLLRETANLNML